MDPISSRILLGAAGAGGAINTPYWISILGTSSADTFNDLRVASNGDIFACGGSASSSSGTAAFIVKFDNFGNVQWQKRGDTTLSTTDRYLGLDIDEATSSLFAVGNAGNDRVIINKINFDGAIEQSRSSSSPSLVYTKVVNINGAPWAVGSYRVVDAGLGRLEQFDSATNSLAEVGLGSTSGNSQANFQDIFYDQASNSIYAVGFSAVSGTAPLTKGLLVKYNTSRTIQWQRQIGDNTANRRFDAVTCDGAGNVYAAGDSLIAKYDPSGNLQWQRILGTQINLGGIDIDNNGNVYVCGSLSTNTAIAKLSSSGTLIWVRTLQDFSSATTVRADDFDNIYIAGFASAIPGGTEGGFDAWVAKLPGDGSLTGVYDGITYATNSSTLIPGSFTSSTSTLPAQSVAINDGAQAISFDSSNAVSRKINIV
jgi:hypothetical protein